MGADIWLGFGRHILTMVGGVLISKGYIDGATLDQVVGATMTLVGFWWSYSHKVTLASVLANAGLQTQVTLVPVVAPAAPVAAPVANT